MNSYEERQERRREQLKNAAGRAQDESTRRFGSADQIASGTLGQPILVGHHSEAGHRRDIARMDTNMRKGIEASKAAEELARRADCVGSGGISSDDPAAIAKLEAEVTRLESQQTRMKSANVLVRKKDRAGLAAAGWTESQIEKLFTPDFAGRLGFPSYAITNNGANIRRIREGIAHLQRMKEMPAMQPVVGEGWSITENVDDNRIVVAFDNKPDRTMLDALKTAGFRWSPTRGAHVRQRSTGAMYAAKRVLGVL